MAIILQPSTTSSSHLLSALATRARYVNRMPWCLTTCTFLGVSTMGWCFVRICFCVHAGVHFRGSGDHKEVWLASRKKRKSAFLPATGINTSFFSIHSFPFLLPLFAVIFPSVVSFVLGILYLSLGSFCRGWGDWVTAVIGVCFCLTTCRLVGRLVLFGPVACFAGFVF